MTTPMFSEFFSSSTDDLRPVVAALVVVALSTHGSVLYPLIRTRFYYFALHKSIITEEGRRESGLAISHLVDAGCCQTIVGPQSTALVALT